MKTLLKKNQRVSLLPEEVKGATEGIVLKSLKNIIEIEIPEAELKYYETDGSIEIFAPVEEGMLYLLSTIEGIETTSVKVKTADKYEILQRREFTRIPLDEPIKIKEDEIKCTCLDISAGGMKIEVNKQLDMEKDYTISFKLENSSVINCFLRPIRISKAKTSKYIVSGRFVLLKNIDKIAIVQFCFKKAIENTNKEK